MGIDRSIRINNMYKIHEKIGEGTFGEVYRVVSRYGHEYAAKFVKRSERSLLERESEVITSIPNSGRRVPGTIYKYYYGQHGNRYVLVVDLLGDSVFNLVKKYDGLSLKTVLMLGIQMTCRLKELHNRGYIHRDVKPDNFMVGKKLLDSKNVYLIDYGFAQSFKDSSNKHKSKTFGHEFIGTDAFASKQAHRGERQSRRSDLESLVYTIIFLFRGKLPWDELSESRTLRMKDRISATELCEGAPDEIKEYYREVRGLSYAERPDYSKLIGYLESAISRLGYEFDYVLEGLEVIGREGQ